MPVMSAVCELLPPKLAITLIVDAVVLISAVYQVSPAAETSVSVIFEPGKFAEFAEPALNTYR